MQAALEAQSLYNVPGNTLEIPLGFPYALLFLCALCVCAETSLLSHNLTKPTILAAMKELEMHLFEIGI